MFAPPNLSVAPNTPLAVYGASSVPLSPTQYRLLRELLRVEGAPLSRSHLGRAAWPDFPPQEGSRSVDIQISRLRRRLEKIGAPTPLLVRGVGYQLIQPRSASDDDDDDDKEN